ncbi:MULTISPECIES: hypothetical protein [Vibrio harveyi group]|uniref:hypothetical protein n=1 Tax=Vibrio harveyi group TaxID=717610 RepID=UPI0035A6ACBF
MKRTLFLTIFLIVGCAQVPKESVELSATVGRDIEKMHKAHLNTVEYLYSRMRQDVERFIDQVYTPYAIKEIIAKDTALLNVGKISFIGNINTGLRPSATTNQQELAIGSMQVLLEELNASVKRQREAMLKPLYEEETQLVKSLNRSYLAIHQANSIVTGHLASVVEVHEAQNEILNEIGIEADLRTIISEELAKKSEEISDLANSTQKQLDKIGGAEAAAEKLKTIIVKESTGQN